MKFPLSSLTQLCITLLGILLANATQTQAQVTSDGTVNTQVNQNGSISEITGGETRGDNLFHSFQDFSVGNGGEAFFNNADSISNILSRVTGGNVSDINGSIRANGSANLFLINPAGIVFGEGSSLNLGGSFYGSSASSILFEGGEFSAADLDSPPLLTVNAPIGLSFRNSPGDIVNFSTEGLFVLSGKTLALAGGNVLFDGGTAGFNFFDIGGTGATLELGGLTESGTVDITENGSLSFPDNVARGDVSLANSSRINLFSEGDGAVFINARNFDLNSDSQISNALLSSSDPTNTQSGDIVINATEDVILDGTDSELVAIINDVFTTGVGQAGKIEISGNNISFVNGGFISSSVANTPQGRSSDVSLTAQENITFSGTDGFSSSGITNSLIPGAQGESGEINIAANNFTIEAGAFIDSSFLSTGNSSNININAADTILIDGRASRIETSLGELSVELAGSGNSGNINLQATNLLISNDGRIATSISGQGQGGNVTIDADVVSIDGNLSEISSETVASLPRVEANQNDAGDVSIITNSLSVTNGGELSTSTNSVGDAGDISITARDSVLVDGGVENSTFASFIPSIIKSDVEAFILSDVVGNSGNVEINTPNLIVSNEGVISASTFSAGNAGNLTINATESLELINDAVVQAEVFEGATGTGGNLTIATANLRLSNGSQISASTRGNGNAGNLTINATDSISIEGGTDTGPSAIIATALVENGRGGELNIFTRELTVSDRAVISVGNFPALEGRREPGTGEAGILNIQAKSIDVESGGSITAATQSSVGEGANITLQVADAITLRDGASISAQAFNQGNGGNLSIDTNFIVAFPNGNNDIIASADQGQGGNININAESVFGIAERSLSDSTNDINASSQVGGLDGTISINTPDLNPVRGATELPTNIVTPERTSAQACNANRETVAKNGFTILGKGGIVPAPVLPLNSLNVLVDGKSATSLSSPAQSISTGYGEIIPAKGLEVREDGQIILTTYAQNISQRGFNKSQNCGID